MRSELDHYEGMRVSCTGYYNISRTFPGNIVAAAVEDIEVEVGCNEKIYIDHCWIQKAKNIVNEKPIKRSRIKFTAVVYKYEKSNPDEEAGKVTAWGLTLPEDIEVDEQYHGTLRPYKHVPSSLQYGLEPVPKTSTAEVVRIIKDMSNQFGTDNLKKVVPEIASISEAIAKCGGSNEFLSLLEILK